MDALKKCLTPFYDVLLWVSALIYAIGGVHYHGALRLTYMGDLWTACGLGYILLRLSFGVRLRDTTFGRSLIQFLEIFERPSLLKSSLSKFSPGSWLLLGLAVYSAVLFLTVPILDHWNFGTAMNDVGGIDNSIYNASRTGRFWTYTPTDGIHPFEYMPFNHLNLGLYVFALIYRVFPRTEIPFLWESLSLLLALIPLYKLGRKVLPGKFPAWLPLVLYLFWTPIYRMNLFELHEPAFLIPFACWAFYFIEVRRFRLAFLFMVLMAIWREDAWWTFSAMCILIGFRSKRWGWPLLGAFVSFLIFPIHAAFFNQMNTVAGRYPELGPNLSSAIRVAVFHPWIIAKMVGDGAGFFFSILKRTSGVFLFSGWGLLPVIPTALEAGLSAPMRDWNLHYVGSFTAPLMVATLYGWKNVDRFLSSRFKNKDLSLLLMKISVAIALCQVEFSLPGAAAIAGESTPFRHCMEKLTAVVPESGNLMVTNRIGGRFGHREWLMVAGDGLPARAEWIISENKNDFPQQGWIRVGEDCGFFVAKRVSTQ